MAIYDDFGERISVFGRNMKKKQEDISVTMKLNSNIRSLDSSLKDYYQILGKMYYDSTQGSRIEKSQLDELIFKIKKTKDEMEFIERQVQQLKGNIECPMCHASVLKGSKFCNVCGYRFPEEVPPQPKRMILCPVCGSSVEEGSIFCQECGTNLSEAVNAVNKKNDTFQNQVCPSCGTPFEPGQMFCTECGCDVRNVVVNDRFGAQGEEPLPEASDCTAGAESKNVEEAQVVEEARTVEKSEESEDEEDLFDLSAEENQ